MRTFSAFKRALACVLFVSPLWASAHVTLQDGSADAGEGYRAVLRVGHGCEGASTTGMHVTLPDGFNGAQPMPKPGWTVTTRSGKLALPYEMHGTRYTEGVLEISWTVNSSQDALPDAFYDEFVFRGTAPGKVGPAWFKVVQSCGTAKNAWVEVPATGTSTKGLKAPAALLNVRESAAQTHHH